MPTAAWRSLGQTWPHLRRPLTSCRASRGQTSWGPEGRSPGPRPADQPRGTARTGGVAWRGDGRRPLGPSPAVCSPSGGPRHTKLGAEPPSPAQGHGHWATGGPGRSRAALPQGNPPSPVPPWITSLDKGVGLAPPSQADKDDTTCPHAALWTPGTQGTLLHRPAAQRRLCGILRRKPLPSAAFPTSHLPSLARRHPTRDQGGRGCHRSSWGRGQAARHL